MKNISLDMIRYIGSCSNVVIVRNIAIIISTMNLTISFDIYKCIVWWFIVSSSTSPSAYIEFEDILLQIQTHYIEYLLLLSTTSQLSSMNKLSPLNKFIGQSTFVVKSKADARRTNLFSWFMSDRLPHDMAELHVLHPHTTGCSLVAISHSPHAFIG